MKNIRLVWFAWRGRHDSQEAKMKQILCSVISCMGIHDLRNVVLLVLTVGYSASGVLSPQSGPLPSQAPSAEPLSLDLASKHLRPLVPRTKTGAPSSPDPTSSSPPFNLSLYTSDDMDILSVCVLSRF
jgi:hypothetical protein